MKCKACDTLMNDYETTRKYRNGEYTELCTECFSISEENILELDGGYSVYTTEELQEAEDYLGSTGSISQEDLLQSERECAIILKSIKGY